MATEALVRIKFSPEGVPQLVQTGRVLDSVKTKVDRLKGSASGVFGKFTQLMSPVTGVFKGVFGAVSSLAMGPFRLLRGAIGLVGNAFMGLVGLIKAHPLVTLVGGFLAAAAMTAFTRSVLTAAKEQEEAFKKVESAAISTGEVVYDSIGEQISAWDVNKGRIESITTALQRKTKFGDEVQMEALSELITVLGDTEKALDTLPLVLDVAARHSLDVVSAARAIGLAMKGDIGLIGRYVPALRGLGKEEKTVENITRILRDTYEGTAETLAGTSSGALAQLGNAWGEVKETIGGVVQDALAPLARWLTDNLYKLNDWIRAVAEGRRDWQTFGSVIFNWLKEIGRGLYNALAHDITSLGPRLFRAARRSLTGTLPYFKELGKGVWEALSSAWPLFVEIMKTAWQKIYPVVQSGVETVLNFYKANAPAFFEAGKDLGLSLGKGVAETFLSVLENKVAAHPLVTTLLSVGAGASAGAALGAYYGVPFGPQGAGFGAIAGGITGGMAGGVFGNFVSRTVPERAGNVVSDIEALQRERETERQRQLGLYKGLSPEAQKAIRRSGEFNLIPPTMEEIAPNLFGKQPMVSGQATAAVNPETVKLLGEIRDEMKAMNRKVATGYSGDVHYFNN